MEVLGLLVLWVMEEEEEDLDGMVVVVQELTQEGAAEIIGLVLL